MFSSGIQQMHIQVWEISLVDELLIGFFSNILEHLE